MTTVSVAMLLAAPALAETGPTQPTNIYDQQIRQAEARMNEMPGRDGNERMLARWDVAIAKANANRTGTPVDISTAAAR
jgi:hypothetical protein